MSSYPTSHLLSSSLFTASLSEDVDVTARVNVSHERARQIALSYNLSLEDILHQSKKFWSMHWDPIGSMDIAAYTLLTIQINLCAGTLAPFAVDRPEIRDLVDDLLQFRVSGQFMLTELGHGLDARNLETTATMLRDGTFELHSPSPQAAKFMPPTLPRGDVPRVGVVMARLIVRGEDRGIRPFVVSLNDGRQMCKGVSARQLPSRHGSNGVGHAITTFTHVKLPFEALLGSLDSPRDERLHFLRTIWRVNIGTLGITTILVPSLKVSSYIAARYSQRRTVSGPDGLPVPILSFRTQQVPIMHALAQGFVLDAFMRSNTEDYRLTPRDQFGTRNALATVFKVITMKHCQRSLPAISDRCGAQGLFAHNRMVQFESEIRGIGIAEGDTLVLSIRLASELLLGRYALPAPRDPHSLLARHEAGLFAECRSLLAKMKSHRSEEFNRRILPLSLPLIEAIGHRMAYEAAIDAGVPEPLLRLYEAGCVQLDIGWYLENGAITRQRLHDMEDAALTEALASLSDYLEASGVGPYANAPILTKEKFDAFTEKLPLHEGNANWAAIRRRPSAHHIQAHL